MPLSLISPENSFIQFYELDADGIETCNTILQKCLPIAFGYDFLFQVYVSGEISEGQQEQYTVGIVDGEGNEVSDEQPFVWVYDSVTNLSWANLETAFDISDLIALGNGACANFQIYINIYNYAYSTIVEAYGHDFTLQLEIDGVMVTVYGGVITSLDDLVAILNGYFTGAGIDALATHTFGTNINIQSADGHVFGELALTDNNMAVTHHYFATVTLATSTPILISNCIQYTVDTCWTTIVKYKGNENQFGFNYADAGFYNSARLRLYYDNPQPLFDENYFVLSNGAKKVLSARYEKEYECHVDYSDEQRHFSLAAAIKHDTVLMGRVTAVDEFSAEGKYDISWLNKPGSNFDSAQASFRIRPTPFFEQNSNCVSS